MFRIAVFETSDIAFRRTIPAILKSDCFQYVGFAIADDFERNTIFKTNAKPSNERIEMFLKAFGGKFFASFSEVLKNKQIDAVYLPLPPGLHFYWAKKILQSGKHLFVEKPFVFTPGEAKELIRLAKQNNLAIHVNYAFLYHKQVQAILDLINNHSFFGEFRSANANFGFPHRGENDFRYDKRIGGGALYDCGCYPALLIDLLFDNESRVTYSHITNYLNHNCALFGNFVLESKNGCLCGNGSYGMDNSYRCDLILWGSKIKIKTDRIFTPIPDYNTVIICEDSMGHVKDINIGCDDQFLNSVIFFNKLIQDKDARNKNFNLILHQCEVLYDIEQKGKKRLSEN